MISIKDNRIRWAISAVLALLILFGTYRNVFSLAAFLLMGLMLVFCDRETSLLQIFFVMPMANIFKFNSEVQSFFTIIVLAYVVLHLILPRRASFVVILFALYILIGQLKTDSFDLFRTIKIICNLLFLSSTLNDNVNVRHKEIFLSYVVGNTTASFWGMMNSNMFKIEQYVGVKELAGREFEDGIIRFAGLYSDPNYYSISIIISLCLLVVLYHRNDISGLLAGVLTVPLICFSVITYSKSAVIMLLLPATFLIYSLICRRKYFAISVFLFITVIVVCLAFSGLIPALDIVFTRLSAGETSEGVDINKLTTGRFDLWVMYAKYIIQNIKIGLFGSGISSSVLYRSAAHNTYLDIFYYLGVVGGLLLILLLKLISAQNRQISFKRNPINYCVIICIVIMYFFLSELFYFDPPFHIFLAFTVLNIPCEGEFKKQIRKGDGK